MRGYEDSDIASSIVMGLLGIYYAWEFGVPDDGAGLLVMPEAESSI